MGIPRWPAHIWVTICIALVTLAVNGFGTYLQWKQLQLPSSSAATSQTGKAPPTRTANPIVHQDGGVSIVPFALTWASSLVLFLLLLMVSWWHARAANFGLKHKAHLGELEAALSQIQKDHASLAEKHLNTFASLQQFMELSTNAFALQGKNVGDLADHRITMIEDLLPELCAERPPKRVVRMI